MFYITIGEFLSNLTPRQKLHLNNLLIKYNKLQMMEQFIGTSKETTYTKYAKEVSQYHRYVERDLNAVIYYRECSKYLEIVPMEAYNGQSN